MTKTSNSDFDSVDESAELDSMDPGSDASDLGSSSASILDDEETLGDLAELSALSGLDDLDDDDESIELGVAGPDDSVESSELVSVDVSMDDSADHDVDASFEVGQPKQISSAVPSDSESADQQPPSNEMTDDVSAIVGQPRAVATDDAPSGTAPGHDVLSALSADSFSEDASADESEYELPGGDDSELRDANSADVSGAESDDMSRNMSFALGKPELVSSNAPDEFDPMADESAESTSLDQSADVTTDEWRDDSAGELGAPQVVGSSFNAEGDSDATLDAVAPVGAETVAEEDFAVDDLNDEFDEGGSIAEGMDGEVAAGMARTPGGQEFRLPDAESAADFSDVSAAADVSNDQSAVVGRPERPARTRRPAALPGGPGGGVKAVLAHVATAVVSVAAALALVHFGVIGGGSGSDSDLPAVSPTAALEQQSQAQQQTLQELQQELQRLEQARQQQATALTDAQQDRTTLKTDIAALRESAAADTAQDDRSQQLKEEIQVALTVRGVAERLGALNAQMLPAADRQQHDEDLQSLQVFLSEASGELDLQYLANAPDALLNNQIAVLRSVESRLIRWERAAQGALVAAVQDSDADERRFLTSSIESLFTQPAQWQDEVGRLEGVANQARWKALVDKAAGREISAGGTWADEPDVVSSSELRSWLLAMQSIRLQSQSIALAQAGQAATQASADVKAALAKLPRTPGSAPRPPLPPTENAAERKRLEDQIRNSVASIHSRLNVLAPARDADADGSDDTAAAPEDAPADDAATIRELIAGLDDEALAQTSVSELRTVARQLQETGLLVGQWERSAQLESLLARQTANVTATADLVALLQSQQKSLAEQLTTDRQKLVALQETHDALATKLTALDRNTATKLTQVEANLTSTFKEELRKVATPQLDELNRLVAERLSRQLQDWGYVLPGSDTPATSTAAENSANPGRARQLFREAYTRVFFSRRDDAADESVRIMTQSVQHDSQNSLYRYFLGLSLYRLGKVDQAIEQIRIGAAIEFETEDGSDGLDQWLERVQHGQRLWLEGIRRDVRLGL